MVFDEKLSCEVSLSRVLDHFLKNGEKPATILGFLEMHKDSLRDVLEWSDALPRLLSLDFVARCVPAENARFAKLLEPLATLYQVNHFMWLVFMCRSLDEGSRLAYANLTKRLNSQTGPYVGRFGSEVLEFDGRFLGCRDAADYAVAAGDVEPEKLGRIFIFDNYSGSLISGRLLQEDVFCMIDAVRQYVIMKSAQKEIIMDPTIVSGLKQLATGVLDLGIRHMACDALVCDRCVFTIGEYGRENTHIGSVVPDIENLCRIPTFNQLAMKLELSGNDRYCDWILLYVLHKRGLGFFRNRTAAGERLLEKYFDIREVADMDGKGPGS